MTADDFRRIALSLPESIESSHMDHPDFRVGGKIFATLDAPSKGWGMVKLWPDQQAEFIQSDPSVFKPAQGAWGQRGATYVKLARRKKAHGPSRAYRRLAQHRTQTHRRKASTHDRRLTRA